MNKLYLLLLMMILTGKLISASCYEQSAPFIINDTLKFNEELKRKVIGRDKAEDFVHNAFPKMDEVKRKKLISAMLAFPFPFGFMGAHRVMLGCKPWVPVVYVATFGGCFGLIPMIDFIAIVCSKDLGQYENNPNVFMWLK